MTLKTDAIDTAVEQWDAYWDEVFPGCEVYLLRRGSNTSDFEIVRHITRGRWARFSSYRGMMVLSVSSLDEICLPDEIALASFFAFGKPDDNDRIDVYSISPEARDETLTNAQSYAWRLMGVRQAGERFRIP